MKLRVFLLVTFISSSLINGAASAATSLVGDEFFAELISSPGTPSSYTVFSGAAIVSDENPGTSGAEIEGFDPNIDADAELYVGGNTFWVRGYSVLPSVPFVVQPVVWDLEISLLDWQPIPSNISNVTILNLIANTEVTNLTFTNNSISLQMTGDLVSAEAVGFDALIETSPVPIPAAAWLFGSAIVGLIGAARRKRA